MNPGFWICCSQRGLHGGGGVHRKGSRGGSAPPQVLPQSLVLFPNFQFGHSVASGQSSAPAASPPLTVKRTTLDSAVRGRTSSCVPAGKES